MQLSSAGVDAAVVIVTIDAMSQIATEVHRISIRFLLEVDLHANQVTSVPAWGSGHSARRMDSRTADSRRFAKADYSACVHDRRRAGGIRGAFARGEGRILPTGAANGRLRVAMLNRHADRE